MSQEALRAATFRLQSKSGAFLGTCFLVLDNGTAITCHHVVSHGAVLEAVDRFGKTCAARWISKDDEELARHDLALVVLDGGADRPPHPLPLFTGTTSGRFLTRVQLREGNHYRESAPLEGVLQGAMAISYRNGGTIYSFHGDLITGLRILPGMSGSPLWDIDHCAVTGLIAAGGNELESDVSGFAAPLANARGSASLSEILRRNAAQVPRFGMEPNQLGASELLRKASGETLQRLRDREIILPEKFVAREDFAKAVADFLTSKYPAFPVGSAAGQGKTSLLAALAEAATSPTWLVRAIDLAIDVPPHVALTRRLSEQVDLPHLCDWQAIARHSDAPPLLLLDGLNELPMARHRVVEEWLPDLIGDVDRAGWKLVFTTRRELLNQLEAAPIQKRLFRPSPGDKASWFILGQFTSAEAKEAQRHYAIPRKLSAAIGREPLILRLASSLENALSRQEVLNAYVRLLLERARRHLSGKHLAALMQHIQAIAVVALGKDEQGVLPYDHVLAQDGKVIEAFCESTLEELFRDLRGDFVVLDTVHKSWLVPRLVLKKNKGLCVSAIRQAFCVLVRKKEVRGLHHFSLSVFL